ncbi:MAG TPA: hypothetical protein VM661_07245 [Candidatus Sulfotelmatobacter sp.]|nr:hypothetical protein [Candidatus Sulfotelmatobacter sp.]
MNQDIHPTNERAPPSPPPSQSLRDGPSPVPRHPGRDDKTLRDDGDRDMPQYDSFMRIIRR